MPQRKSDHDTLTGFVSSFNEWKDNVNQRFTEIRNDIKEIKDGTVARIEGLEKSKADRVVVDKLQKIIDDDIEKRMRAVELCAIPKDKQESFEKRQERIENKLVWIFAWAAGAAAVIAIVIDLASRYLNIGR